MDRDSQDSAREPFLKDDSEKQVTRSDHQPQKWRWSTSHWIHLILLVLNIIFASINLGLVNVTSTFPRSSFDNLDRTWTRTVFRNLTGNPYAGPPSTDVDETWERLMAPMHMRVSESELRRDNQESVRLTESGGYLAWMGVFHELHCIRMLQKWNYRDYYHPNISEAEHKHLVPHVDHCIEILRQASMCRADASMTTFTWHPNKTEPMFNATESVHTCVDWSILMDSVSDRVILEDEIARLQNPLMNGLEQT